MKTVTLNIDHIRIRQWIVDVAALKVIVFFDEMTDTGQIYRSGEVTFWVTMPDPGVDPQTGVPLPLPAGWFQLPPGHLTTLAALTTEAQAALEAMYL